jgi:hypothetical protein
MPEVTDTINFDGAKMSDPDRYTEVVQRLAAYGYEVQPDPPGYIVQHGTNRDDLSRARHLDDLADLAELIEWAARRHEQSMYG